MGHRISACLVIYNEESVIERCLKSLVGIVDEIIIVHDGSCSDASLDICRKYTDRIIIAPHYGIAERHRPRTYTEASGEWIIQLDADEYLSDELRNGIPNLIGDERYDAYELFWPFWNGTRYITKHCFHKRALFRKSAISFVGVSQSNAEVDPRRVAKTNLLLEHRPIYDNFQLSKFRTKWLKWAKIQAGEYMRPITDIPQFGTEQTAWPSSIQNRIKHPVYFTVFDFFYNFLGQLKGGLWREGLSGWRIALLKGMYYSSVCVYVYRLKQANSSNLT